MERLAGEAQDAALGLTFDRRLKLEFHGSKITSDGGLLASRELDEALGLSTMAGEGLTDTRTGTSGRHTLLGQFRQSVFGRLAGYEDVNTIFHLAEVALPQALFRRILEMIDDLRPKPIAPC